MQNSSHPKSGHRPTSIEKFGKDHWSLLAYVESRCVAGQDGRGQLQRGRMRCHPQTHRTVAGPYSHGDLWRQTHGTRLAGFFEFDGRNDPEQAIAAGLQLRDHDDWDCLDDLEVAGFIQVHSIVNGVVTMTEEGCAVAARLRAHKACGGMFATFSLSGAGDAATPHQVVEQTLPSDAVDKGINLCDYPELTEAYFGDAIFNRAGESLITTVQAARSEPPSAEAGEDPLDLDFVPTRLRLRVE